MITPLGEAVTQLPWLAPCATSLVTLARSSAASVWEAVRDDPGAVLLLVRQTAAEHSRPGLSFFPALLHDPAVLERAFEQLHFPSNNGFVNWTQPAVRPVYVTALRLAHLAQSLAERTDKTDPDTAWIAGLLAPLGWLAQAAAADTSNNGLEPAAIARRLARSWHLPAWLNAVTGHLGLSVETAQALGADRELFLITQLAVGLLQRRDPGLHLPVGATPAEALVGLGLPATLLRSLEQEAGRILQQIEPTRKAWQSPFEQPLLRDLLSMAAENRRLKEAPLLSRLESEVDDLHHALEDQRHGEAERLQARKLNALAEFAAGAGHEINNPLAVISGQAQYLLKAMEKAEAQTKDPEELERGDQGDTPSHTAAFSAPLHTIIGQTHRIHHILNDLMQFARPPRPQKQSVDLASLAGEVVASLQELAAQRKVRLVWPATPV